MNARDGIIVAGGHGNGSAIDQLSTSGGIVIDKIGAIFVADEDNHRIVRISPDTRQTTVIAGGKGRGNATNQFDRPFSLSLDSQNNIFVSDWGNARIQLFESNSSVCNGAVSNYLSLFQIKLTFFFSFVLSAIHL